MSIITDALKKAERERELKGRRSQEESSGVALEEPRPAETVSLELTPIGEALVKETPVSQGHSSKVSHFKFSNFQARDFLILSSAVVVCFLILLILTRWPSIGRNFSVNWKPRENAGFFRVGVPGDPSRSSIPRVQPGRVEKGSFVQLPFNLSGIAGLGEDRYAIVNHKIVQEGDSVDGAFVKEILNREVVLETRSGEIKLKIAS